MVGGQLRPGCRTAVACWDHPHRMTQCCEGKSHTPHTHTHTWGALVYWQESCNRPAGKSCVCAAAATKHAARQVRHGCTVGLKASSAAGWAKPALVGCFQQTECVQEVKRSMSRAVSCGPILTCQACLFCICVNVIQGWRRAPLPHWACINQHNTTQHTAMSSAHSLLQDKQLVVASARYAAAAQMMIDE